MDIKGTMYLKGQNKELATDLPINKTEKLLTAVYIISDHIEDKPLQNKIRSNALELVSSMRCLNCRMDQNLFKESLRLVDDLNSCINLAATMSFISAMNGEVISKVLTGLKDSISNCKTGFDKALDQLVMVSGEPASPELQRGEQKKIAAATTGKPALNWKPAPKKEERVKVKPIVKMARPTLPPVKEKHPLIKTEYLIPANKDSEVSLSKGHNGQDNGQIQEKDNGQPFGQKERRDNIIALARELREFSIKDMAAKLPNIGEKTLQRELVSLFEAGILKKQGEKRWVKYSF